jgi:Cys-tRNA(Pro) deacylase
MDESDSQIIKRLRSTGLDFAVHRFPYEVGGGTARSSRLLGVPEYAVVKTLVFEDDQRKPLVVLMHGDKNVDTRKLAQHLGVTKIWSCAPEVAESLSGWPVGSTNPFALKTLMPIFMEKSVQKLPTMYINGGGRGLLVSMAPLDFMKVVEVRLVDCAKEKPVVSSKSP